MSVAHRTLGLSTQGNTNGSDSCHSDWPVGNKHVIGAVSRLHAGDREGRDQSLVQNIVDLSSTKPEDLVRRLRSRVGIRSAVTAHPRKHTLAGSPLNDNLSKRQFITTNELRLTDTTEHPVEGKPYLPGRGCLQ